MSSLSRPLLLFLLFVPLTAQGFAAPVAETPSSLQSLITDVGSLLEHLENVGSLPPSTSRILRDVHSELRALDGAPPSELVRHLEAQLRQVAHPGARSHPHFEQWWRDAAATLQSLQEKQRRLHESIVHLYDTATVPPNDLCADALTLVDTPVSGNTSGATNDGGASCGDSASSPDIWFEYTADADGAVVFDTFGSAFDTVLSLHSQCPALPELYEISCNDDASGGIQSRVATQFTAGQSVLVRVAGLSGATGELVLNFDDSTGAISGTVVKAGSNAPRPGAEIHLRAPPYGHLSQIVSTSTEGEFLFAGLEPGDHHVLAKDEALIDEVWNDHPCIHCMVTSVGDPITVGSNLVEGIDFALEPGGSITGTVLDRDSGEAVVFADIAVLDSEGFYATDNYTTHDGSYRVDGLPAGTFFVRADGWNHARQLYDGHPCEPSCDLSAADAVTVSAGTTTTGIDFDLVRLGSIGGRVTHAATGAPLEGVWVNVLGPTGYIVDGALSRSDGSYLVERLRDGDYFVRTDGGSYLNELYDDQPCQPSCDLTAGVPVTVAGPPTTTGIDFDLHRLGRLAGVVLDAETGLPFNSQVNVVVFDQSGSVWVSGGFAGSDGSYEVWGIPEGTHFARAALSSDSHENQVFDDVGCDPGCDVTTGKPIEVFLDTTVVGIDFYLRPCAEDSYHHLDHLVVLSDQTWKACRSITVGPDTTFSNGTDIILVAGERVEFRDGFKVDGGSLQVVIDSDVGKE